jgi:UDP-glucose 4-epimerase
VELANAGYEPVIVDDLRNSEERVLGGIHAILGRPVTNHRIDCNDSIAFARVFEKEGPVYGVIHFAADKAVGESVRSPLKYYRNNIGSLITLLELMERFSVEKLVFSSSCTVYGQPSELPVKETFPDRQANSPYGTTKVVCEQLIRDECVAIPKLEAVLLRYFNPIGAHPSGLIGELPLGIPSNLVPFVTQTAAGLREALTINGGDYDTEDGSCVRDYIHVTDLAQAHVKALEWLSGRSNGHDVFNLGIGKGETVLNVVRTFERVNGVQVPYTIGPRRPGDVEAIYADASKSREVLGWEPRYSLEDALRDAWRWQQNLMRPGDQNAMPNTMQE